MKQYRELLLDVMANGESSGDRTGTGTTKVFGRQMRFDLKAGFPMVTGKKVPFRSVIGELLWFISGDTNIKWLNDNGITIWDEWASTEGHLNRIYGAQWRSWEVADWTHSVCEVKIRHGGVDAPFKPTAEPIPALCDQQIEDDFVGRHITNNSGDWFTVVGKMRSNGSKNSTYVVRFDNTQSIVQASRPSLRSGSIKDPYKITVYGQGCLGIYNEITPIRKRAHTLWYNMMKRCYDPNLPEYCFYGGNGVFVDREWRCFANFLRDIHNIPYFAKWVENPSQYDLDKDYFGAMSYGPSTCIFLPTKYNQALSNIDGSKYIATNKLTGKKYEFTIQSLFARQHGIKHSQVISTAINNSPTSSTKMWTFERVYPRPGYLYRQRLMIDQLQRAIDTIKTNPDSRRIIVNAWNPSDLEDMALPPCHMFFQFQVSSKGLSCHMYQRSVDCFLGLPFNIASYAALTHMVANVCNLPVHELIWSGGDVHIYNNHIDQVNEYLSRQTYDLPKLSIAGNHDNIDSFEITNFALIGYECGPTIKADVSI